MPKVPLSVHCDHGSVGGQLKNLCRGTCSVAFFRRAAPGGIRFRDANRHGGGAPGPQLACSDRADVNCSHLDGVRPRSVQGRPPTGVGFVAER